MHLKYISLCAICCLALSSINDCCAQTESIPILNKQDAQTLRETIQDYVWGGEEMPSVQPMDPANAIEYYLNFWGDEGKKFMSGMEVFNLSLKHGFTSEIYLLHPVKNNGLNIPIIYHSGHGQGGFDQDYLVHNDGGPYSRSVVNFFLDKGYDVIMIDMPMNGNNAYPDSVTEDGVTYPITVHDDLFKLKKPYYYFLAPIKTIIDYLQVKKGYKKFYMTGFSGGGWTTAAYSAIDTRIERSFPVAGSVPVPWQLTWSNRGDNEQHYWDFYDRFNYSTLYFLAAEGYGRMSVQVNNKFDNCCFAIDGTRQWAKDVQEKLKSTRLPGKFNFFFDSYATWHRMSSVTVDTIFNYMTDYNPTGYTTNLVSEVYEPKVPITVYPNPASGILNVNINNFANNQFSYTITSISGNRIKSGVAFDDDHIDIRKLTRGLYIIEVRTSDGNRTQQKFWVK